MTKIQRYCAQAEHCTHDVQKKLSNWNLPEEEHPAILMQLRNDHFLDDARYARHFILEKWNLYRWGKLKIFHHLTEKVIPEPVIQNAWKILREEEYTRGVWQVLTEKWNSYGEHMLEEKCRKIQSFAISRGYEDEILMEWLHVKGLP